jgi:predicted HicB family RNase H-like nuclease
MMPRPSQPRRDDQSQAFKFRMPPEVYAQLQEQAAQNRRSINSELLLRLERSLEKETA